jgi:hypothetical protein
MGGPARESESDIKHYRLQLKEGGTRNAYARIYAKEYAPRR